MTRNQLSPKQATKYESSPIFTVDVNGNVQPQTAQSVVPEGHFLIQPADPTASSQYLGYVCAWRNGACQCSALISNLGSKAHMRINDTPYAVQSTAPAGDYTLYTTTSEIGGSGPMPLASVGDIHIGNGG